MDELMELSQLLKSQNSIQQKISQIIKRPALTGHLGEFIAENIFEIELNKSASQKGIDGYFKSGKLSRKSVNIKYHGKHDGLLNINPAFPLDYYLVLTGPKLPAISSRNQLRPFTIHFVFLLDSVSVITDATNRGVKIGIATAFRKAFWDRAEIYPTRSNSYPLSDHQISQLKQFHI